MSRLSQGRGLASGLTADHSKARSYPDANLEPTGLAGVDPAHCLDQFQRGTNGPFRLMLVGPRISEIGQNPVVQWPIDRTTGLGDCCRAVLVEGGDEWLQVFRITPSRREDRPCSAP